MSVPTAAWRELRGKYARIFAEEHRYAVETWYNQYATSRQRRAFKGLVREVHELAGLPARELSHSARLAAEALLRQHQGCGYPAHPPPL